jgi:HAD superfamily hydrolase (TIGR01509 family)
MTKNPSSEVPEFAAAVLFDMDGLLVDSEPVWFDVEAEVMAGLGVRWTKADQAACVGGPTDRSSAYMLDLAGSDLRVEELEGRLVAGMVDRLHRHVPLRPGAVDLVDAVRSAGVPAALVSSSHRLLVDAALTGLGRERFDVTIAGDEIEYGKPGPEPYLAACAWLDVAPSRCVVLEDSPVGVASGQAAGCVVVAVPSVTPVEPADRRVVIDTLEGIDLNWLLSLPDAFAEDRVASC